VNARDENDLNEEKIRKSLGTAMGSNYDAGQKTQGNATGGVASTKEGVQIQKAEMEKAAQTRTARALPQVDPAQRQQV